MSAVDELFERNARYAESFTEGGLPVRPARKLAVVACMDSRMDMVAMLGMGKGDAHMIRNAGGVVTDDVIRSLVISQRLLGTREIMLIHHTDCGMTSFAEEDLKQAIVEETGVRPPFAFETFKDPEADVRQSIARIEASPFVPHKDQIRGFVYDVKTGRLNEVR